MKEAEDMADIAKSRFFQDIFKQYSDAVGIFFLGKKLGSRYYSLDRTLGNVAEVILK